MHNVFRAIRRIDSHLAWTNELRLVGSLLAIALAVHLVREFFTREGFRSRARLVFPAAFVIVCGWCLYILSPRHDSPRTGEAITNQRKERSR